MDRIRFLLKEGIFSSLKLNPIKINFLDLWISCGYVDNFPIIWPFPPLFSVNICKIVDKHVGMGII